MLNLWSMAKSGPQPWHPVCRNPYRLEQIGSWGVGEAPCSWIHCPGHCGIAGSGLGLLFACPDQATVLPTPSVQPPTLPVHLTQGQAAPLWCVWIGIGPASSQCIWIKDKPLPPTLTVGDQDGCSIPPRACGWIRVELHIFLPSPTHPPNPVVGWSPLASPMCMSPPARCSLQLDLALQPMGWRGWALLL